MRPHGAPEKNAEHKCVTGACVPTFSRLHCFFSATKNHFEELFVDLFERVDPEKPKMVSGANC